MRKTSKEAKVIHCGTCHRILSKTGSPIGYCICPTEVTRVLHLTLIRHWFDEIATGRKTHEYRSLIPFWSARLLNKGVARVYDEVHFRNGYHSHVPFMRVEWKGLGFTKLSGRMFEGAEVFDIILGKVLEIRNWEGPAK